jgi:hypothetical protein
MAGACVVISLFAALFSCWVVVAKDRIPQGLGLLIRLDAENGVRVTSRDEIS